MNSKILDLVNSLKINIEGANYVVAGSIWEEFVNFWQHNRLYLIKDDSAVLYLKDRKIPLEKGKMYFIPPHSVVGGKCELFGHYFCHFRIESPFEDLTDFISFDDVLVADELDEKLFENIIDNYPADTPQKILALDGAFKLLFSKFLASAKLKNNKASEFTEVIKFITDNATKNISLKDIAEKSKFNPTYFCSVFKETFGITPWNFLIKCRLDLAVSLLTSTSTSIKEIAEKSGFPDEFYFSRVFKKHYGVSPQKFKKNYHIALSKSNAHVIVKK